MANSPDSTVVGEVMKHGGGAVVGAWLGYLGVTALGILAAPITGGVSIPVSQMIAAGGVVGGGIIGHKVANQ